MYDDDYDADEFKAMEAQVGAHYLDIEAVMLARTVSMLDKYVEPRISKYPQMVEKLKKAMALLSSLGEDMGEAAFSLRHAHKELKDG